MAAKLFAAVLIAAACGCRMCSDSCDYSPPVAGSPYTAFDTRAGSAFSGEPIVTTPTPPPRPSPDTTPPVTQPPMLP
jgi:hypothetical protein